MTPTLDPNSGLYVLVLEVGAPIRIGVGALGPLPFQAGWYLYVGSARKNLRQRVERHLSATKKVRWHVDYLTTRKDVRLIGAVMVTGGSISECELNRIVGREVPGAQPVPRFGASDCRQKCPAHLWWRQDALSLDDVAALIPGPSDRPLALPAPRGRVTLGTRPGR